MAQVTTGFPWMDKEPSSDLSSPVKTWRSDAVVQHEGGRDKRCLLAGHSS